MFTVYKTTNLANDKFYIGVHETDEPNDSYLGSGNQLTAAVKKYGAEGFRKEILFTSDAKEEAYAVEAQLVTEAEVLDPKCYNLKPGGIGGWDHWNHTSEAKDARLRGAVKTVVKNKLNSTGRNHDPKYRFSKDNPNQKLGNLPENRLKAVAKVKETFALIGHSQGSKNSQFGTVWCVPKDAVDITARKKFKKDSVPDGWISTMDWRAAR